MDKPSLPKGTRDFGPAVMARRQYILQHITSVYRKFGFLPLETPAMENLSTLTGKYGEEGDQLLFKILNSGDFLKDVDEQKLTGRNSKSISFDISEKGLRYDLTVPFARYVVMNKHEIAFPFKRYQVQPVWRADRPQKGRYREFYQCDADVVGTDSLLCEAEIILMIKEVMTRLRVSEYTIKINHRGVLNGMAEVIGAKGKEMDLFVAIDKLDKIGEDKVREELIAKNFDASKLDLLFTLLSTSGSNAQKLTFLEEKFRESEAGKKGTNDLRTVFTLLTTYQADDSHVELDMALARGLSYYTGCIFEVKIANKAGIGSISGGGRYDNLTASFGDKENLSGVGFSFGVDRLYDVLDELELFPKETQVSSRVLICHFDEASQRYGLSLLASLREKGIASEIYPDQAKIKKQLDYANKKMIPFTIVIGSDEMNTGLMPLKNMETGEQEKLSREQILQKLN
jgi:histidyl-tRNA synthetase